MGLFRISGGHSHNLPDHAVIEVELLRDIDGITARNRFVLHVAVVGIHSDDPSNGTFLEMKRTDRFIIL